MNKKVIILGVVSLAVVGLLTYIYFRNKKKSSSNEKDKLSPTEKDKLSPNKKDENLINVNKSSSVDNNSQAVKITENKLKSLKELLSFYEFKKNSIFDKGTGNEISVNARWSVWGLLNSQYNSLVNGVKNDKSINQETKEYANKVLQEHKKELEKVFPPNIFNTSSEFFKKYNLEKFQNTNIYNEKI